MRSTLFIIITLLLTIGVLPAQTNDANRYFEDLAHRYIENLLAFNPEWATVLGDHRHDHRLSDFSAEAMKKQREFQLAYRDSLGQIDPGLLSTTNRIDRAILLENINSAIFEQDTIRGHEWNPLYYNWGDAIYNLLIRDFAPLEERLQNVKARLQAVPVLLTQARENLKNPPRIFTETAIEQNQGLISLVRDELESYLDQVPALESELNPLREQTIEVIEEYGRWLEQELLPRSNGDFRLGESKFRSKLRYSLESNLSLEEILRRAEKDLRETQAAAYETALPLYKKYFPHKSDSASLADRKQVIRSVLDRLADDHPAADEVVEYVEECLRRCADFVKERDLATMPSEPVKTIEMPEYARGVAVAECDSPGPLEPGGETYFSIAPPPKDWSTDQIDSYFREYNNYMLVDLTIHEGIPGHYLQGAFNNKFKAPTLVRAIWGSGVFVEGWACYTEQLMAEMGLGGSEVKLQQLKMRLRIIANAILDQKIHAGNLSEEEALAFMMDEAFQEKSEAVG